MMDKMDKKALLNVKEMCEYLGIGQTKARELLSDPKNNFTIRIGNRLYAHKGRLDTWLLNQILQVKKVAFMYLRYIPNDTLKWLKNSRFYGSIDGIFDVSLSKLQPRKEAQMGKSLNGKELGKGISQRKDGLYQARFVNRFGKRETIYAKTLNEIRHQLRTEQYEDEKMLNVISKEMTLDEWYEIWMNTCKKNCRSSTKETYAGHYRRIQKELGWIKLTNLNLIVLQQVFNELRSDNERKNSKKILADMLEKSIDAELLIKNVAKQINTKVSKEDKKERRVLTVRETELFLKQAEKSIYYNLFIVALETGLRIGELMALTWSDIDLKKKVLYVRHTLCYFRKGGKYTFEMHDTKTKNGRRTIPLTQKAYEALRKQKVQKLEIELKGRKAPEGYEDLVFVTRNNRPTQQFIVQEGIRACVRNIQKKCPEFEKFSPHCFRHTFATRAIENGMQPKTLQKILGHGSLQMTMDLYCHVTDDTLFEAMRLMEKVV